MNRALQRLKQQIVPVLRKHDVIRAGIFGSYARGEQKKKSDVDLLIRFNSRKKKSYFDLIEIELELHELILKKMDVHTYNALHPLLKQRILKEEVKILR